MRLLSGRPDVYLDLDGPTPKHKVDGGPAEVDTCARRCCHAEIAVWVFERNICLSVPVRVVSVAAGLGCGHSRIVSPAEPSGEPLGRRVPLAYVSSQRISSAALTRTASYSASRGTRCEVIGAATACPTGRRSWCYGHPRARGDQWPRLSEGTVQIHRNTDANRVDVHRRACERCGRAAGHQQRSSHHYFLL